MSQQMYLNGLHPPAGKDIFCIVWDLSAHCSYPAAVLLPTHCQTRKVPSVIADGSRGSKCCGAVFGERAFRIFVTAVRFTATVSLIFLV